MKNDTKLKSTLIYGGNRTYFLKGLQKILPVFGLESTLPDKQTDSFRSWTYEEDEQLEQLIGEHKSVEELSQILHRSEGTVHARLEKLKISV